MAIRPICILATATDTSKLRNTVTELRRCVAQEFSEPACITESGRSNSSDTVCPVVAQLLQVGFVSFGSESSVDIENHAGFRLIHTRV